MGPPKRWYPITTHNNSNLHRRENLISRNKSFLAIRSLHEVHKMNAQQGDIVRPSTCFISEAT